MDNSALEEAVARVSRFLNADLTDDEATHFLQDTICIAGGQQLWASDLRLLLSAVGNAEALRVAADAIRIRGSAQ